MKKELTHLQLQTVYSQVDDIISTLDNMALNELFNGNLNDVDLVLESLFDETANVIAFDGGKIKSGSFGYLDRFSNQVDESLKCYSLNYFIVTTLPEFIINWHHIEWGNLVQIYKKLSIIASRDHGKCLGENTPVLMYNGTIKLIQDIKIGDLVMGIDSQPRTVLSIHNGIDKLYKIIQSNAMDYNVNSKHILTIIEKDKRKTTRKKNKPKQILNERIRDAEISVLLKKTTWYLDKCIRGFKVPVEFIEKKLLIDPYFLGLWLGDGSKHNTSITTNDTEIIEYLRTFADENNLDITYNNKFNYLLKRKNGTPLKNTLKQKLKTLNVLNNKHIPENYIINSKENRLKLLAGLIDSDGSFRDGGFHITSKYEQLTLQIKRIADSLGFKTFARQRTKFVKYLNKNYYSYDVSISGNLFEIPTKIKRKQVLEYKKPSNKDKGIIDGIRIGKTSSLKFEDIGEGEYFGFMCDGDNRFLLADGTVTHNSYYFSFAYLIWKMYRYLKSTTYRIVPLEYRLSKMGMLITNEFNLAKHLLSLVKEEIENNDLLREKLFPGTDHKWAETEITCKNGASLIVKSFGSKMRGFHPGYVVSDDFMNDSVIYSEKQCNKYISIFTAIITNMLLTGGQAINVGTPYTTKDLFAYLKGIKSWFTFEYPAIFPDGSLLWAERHNIQALLDKKETQGSLIFSREILCRPISSESTIFPWEILQRSFLGMDEFTIVNNIWSHPKKFKRVAIGCDFSISANVGADYSVFIVLGVDEFNNYWLLNMYRDKGKKYTEQIAILKKLYTDFKPDVIFVESNQMQVIFAQGLHDAGLPVVEHNTGTNKHDLRSGLPGLAILFENSKFRFPRGDQKSKDITDIICLELSSVTWTEKQKLEGVGEHDDTCMGLWIAKLAADYINSSFDFTFI
jgi:hypothetical protein